uniref:DUF4382 domain-containing protein n=1 Tax=Candidatus Electrothrix sp. TaxID=2170559 RepID=UPI0040578ABB
MEACARGKGCIVAGGPMQVNLLDMAKDNIDYVNQVLLPERTRALRFILGDNSTITVDGESFPLTVPSGKRSGLKLKGEDVFPLEGGLLAGISLDFDLGKALVVRGKKSGSSYKLKPVIKVATAEITPMTDGTAAVLAMPDEDSEITIGDKFSLFIPAGAVSAPMVISVKETKFTVEVWDKEAGEVIEKPALSSNYELSPDGAEFAVPLVTTISYDPETLPSEVTEYDLAVYLDEERVPTDINTVSRTATADVWHFTSEYIGYAPCTNGNGDYCGSADPKSTLPPDNLYNCKNSNWTEKKQCANGCLTMATGIPDMCSAGDNAFVFPFERDNADDVWQICQGYNNDKISHNGSLRYSFDFAYGSNNACNGPKKGCCGTSDDPKKDASGSEDETVIAPAAGKIAWSNSEMTCLNLQDAAPNGDGQYIVSVMLGHMKSGKENSRVVNAVDANGKVVKVVEVSQSNSLGILRGIDEDFGYAHIHMSAYAATNCKGTNVPLGTVFGGDYDFSSDGRTFSEWYGKKIPSGDAPSDDDLVLKEVRVTAQETLYAGGTAKYTAEADLAENITTGSLPIPGKVVKTIDVTDECSWLATPLTYVASLGGGLVQAESTAAGQTVKVTCSYDHSPSDIQLAGRLSVVVAEEPASCPNGNGLYCGSVVSRNENNLYRCTDGVYSVEEQCSNGCETMPSGTDDRCMSGSTVRSKVTGRVWMAFDLGQTKAAQDYGDPNTQGSLYQWGRRTDGHESRTSETSDEVISATENSAEFITEWTWFSEASYPGADWNALNNPCPEGFAVPTVKEFLAEYPAGVPVDYSDNVLGLGGSSGYRSASNGQILDSSTNPYSRYWSNDYTDNPGTYPTSSLVNINPGDSIHIGISDLGYGASVRCIKSL